MSRPIKFYRTSGGACPVEEFLDSLTGRVAQKVAWVLKLIEDLDVVPSQYFSKLSGTNEIWECRIIFSSNIYRIFSFWYSGEVILTHGLVKKTRRTPQREIDRAETIKRDYLARYEGGDQ